MTSASQSLNKEFGALKTAAAALDASTPLDQVRKTRQDLRDLQERIQETVRNNPQAIMALALSQKALPKLINNCEALLPPDARTDTAHQQPATRLEADTVSHTPVVVHTVAMEGLSHPTMTRPTIRGQRKAPTAAKMQLQNTPAKTEAPAAAAPVTEIRPVLSFPSVAVIVHCDVPGDTRLFIRGTAEGMNWAKGTELKRVNGKFVLESDRDLGRFEFKILRDDQHWSQGDNFVALPGQTSEVSPRF